ncbi:hypothetical protein ATANTOWER_030594 [Ataeniobius toweri]|uniref:Uncharacterized protein n=1 Tax=Ataeniobius toweri TaxID=208326 RepID=A0ABU7BIN3_9TELE|nr:hypothetical protein [Ataeniobius toweri]
MHVATMERKNSLLTGRNLQQNQAQCERPSATTAVITYLFNALPRYISALAWCILPVLVHMFRHKNAYYILKIWTVQFCCFSIELRFVYLPKTDGQAFCSGDAPPVVGVPEADSPPTTGQQVLKLGPG